ncbi:hypothetical protein [uncultured Mesonia sp.]|uniref:hypothetical protein n=1 Tax=uncultured Mesonia sp. TaxID=399731 RepID=UPI00374E389E
MKTKLFVLGVLSLLYTQNALYAQTNNNEGQVEDGFFSVQTGFLGVWGQYEFGLSNTLALRTEVGLDMAAFGGSIYQENNRVNYALAPVISAEPRWYYNLKKRAVKKRKTSKNSGNFLAIQTAYNPDWFVVSNVDNLEVIDQIRIVPKWGIRRSIGKHFNYELGLGVGYVRAFIDEDKYLYKVDKDDVFLDLHIRIGYSF